MRARTHMRAGTCTHKHTKLSIKGETKLKIQVGLKMSKNEQIIFSSACSVWLFCQYLYEWKYFFFFFLLQIWAPQGVAMLVCPVPVWCRKGLPRCMFDIFTTQSGLVHDFTDTDCRAWKQRLVSCFKYLQTPGFFAKLKCSYIESDSDLLAWRVSYTWWTQTSLQPLVYAAFFKSNWHRLLSWEESMFPFIRTKHGCCCFGHNLEGMLFSL